ALNHHERWDGKGYPNGLSGEAIPLEARIVAVADAFDAISRNRVHRRGLSLPDAIAEIARNAGTQFDPMVVEAFMRAVDAGEVVHRQVPGRAAGAARGRPAPLTSLTVLAWPTPSRTTWRSSGSSTRSPCSRPRPHGSRTTSREPTPGSSRPRTRRASGRRPRCWPTSPTSRW